MPVLVSLCYNICAVMKNIFRFLTIITSVFFVYQHNASVVLAKKEIQRDQFFTKNADSNCPVPTNPDLISICGTVTQTNPVGIGEDGEPIPSEEILGPEDVYTWAAGQPVKGVSVYLYECDNSSPTCKREGNIVRPFSSTSTDEGGAFHLVARKMDDPIQTSSDHGDTPAQSKVRYLIFSCGSTFSGMQRIPSYGDLGAVVQDVPCPPAGSGWAYVPPMNRYDVVDRLERLAAHMGIDDQDGYYPTQYPESSSADPEGYHVAAQVYFDQIDLGRNSSMELELTGGDFRFSKVTDEDGNLNDRGKIIEAYLDDSFPKLGSWWSLDCTQKYRDTGNPDDERWARLCAAQRGPVISGETTYTSIDPDDYETDLYEKDAFLVQTLLPNIPPKEELLFYKEFTARQDLVEYAQDPTDVARFLGAYFSNCGGPVDLRTDMADYVNIDGKEYINCELLKMCGFAVDETGGYSNKYTKGAPGSGLANPASYQTLIEEMDPEIPVCSLEGRDKPVTIGEIQPPQDLDPSKYVLDGSYWNPELLVYLGRYNMSGKYNYQMGNREDSYNSSECNSNEFAIGKEGKGVPMAGCTSMIFPSGTKGNKWANNNSVAMGCISSGNCGSVEPMVNTMANTIRNYEGTDPQLELDKLKYQMRLFVEGPFILYNTEETKALPEVSNVNPKVNNQPEMMITNKSQDTFRSNVFFQGNEGHYPEQDFTLGGLFTGDDRTNEERTPNSAIYLTSAAWKREQALSNGSVIDLGAGYSLPAEFKGYNDKFDSLLTTSYGEGNVDWEFLGANTGVLQNLWLKFNLWLSKALNKTFVDRDPSGLTGDPTLIDSLLATGFSVNEANFKDIFPLPSIKTGLQPEDWGPNNTCYPWHEVGIGLTCGTYKRESEASDGSTNRWWSAASGGVSRTCRVDLCKATYAETQCTCTRTVIEDPVSGDYDVSYSKNNCKVSDIIVDGVGECGDVDDRLKCAQDQITCYPKSKDGVSIKQAKDCIKEQHKEELTQDKIEEKITCDASLFSSDPEVPGVITKTARGKVGTPSCVVSRAGPYECEGDVFRNSSTQLTQQQSDLNSDLDQVSLDDSMYTSIESANAWKNPAETVTKSFSGGLVTTNSSIRNSAEDLSKEGEVISLGAGLNPLWVRRQFSSPLPANLEMEFEPLYLHCNSGDLGVTGESWDCNLSKPPEPEIVDIKSLNVDPECALNTENPTCQEILLRAYKDEGFSDTFAQILGAAGTRYKVSAAVIAAYYINITTTDLKEQDKWSFYWAKDQDDLLYNVSAPWYGGFDMRQGCFDLEIPEQGPYDWILNWFANVINTEGADAALDELALGRSKTASRCNFLDATYVAAANMSTNKAGVASKTCKMTADQAQAAVMKLAKGFNSVGVYANPSWTQEAFDTWNACKSY